jgi:hypothetical protein
VQKSAGSRPGAVHDALCPLAGRGDLCFLGAGDPVGPGFVTVTLIIIIIICNSNT